MSKEEFVMDLIFDNPMTYQEIMKRTGYKKIDVYKILERINANKIPDENRYRYVVYSGDKIRNEDEEDKDDFLDSMM